ncbi:hypothetical protein [Rhodococcus sp. JS3073]|uniref:hypothetical protein n=1 Tax=Rhodococcus sp. JS3073 TaxID=3002901 RepID=UPI0022869768|nr:hypothetical protein [Rhodococcus sp. JS3073]WAM19059.1 hypothetical protein OYT95_41620 [Rhodococcus sp. JS3073]
MSTSLKKVVDDQLTASGMAAEQLDDVDAKYVAAGVKNVLSNLKARRACENHIGAILTHKQAVDATDWTKQALSQAVRDSRVLRLEAADWTIGYWSGGLTDTAPHVPIVGIKDVLKAWASADAFRPGPSPRGCRVHNRNSTTAPRDRPCSTATPPKS